MGARAMVSTRMSVILRPDGLEFVLVFCGSASRAGSAQKAPPKNAAFRINERRPAFFMNGPESSFPAKRHARALPVINHAARPVQMRKSPPGWVKRPIDYTHWVGWPGTRLQ